MSKSILKNSIFNTIKTLVTMLFPLITFSYASRILLPEGMGKIDFAKSISTILTMLSMLGMNSYGLRECARIRDDKEKLSKTVKELLAINSVTSLCAYAVMFMLLLLSDKMRSYTAVILIYGLMIGLTTVGIEWLYTALEEFRYVAVRTCAVQVLALVLMLLFVRTENDVWKYAVIQVISQGGAFVFNFVHSGKYINYRLKCGLELKKHIKPLIVLFLTSAFIEVYVTLDTAMLGMMSSDKYVGYYSAAYKISTVLCRVVLALLQVFIPRMAYYAERGLKDEYKTLINKAMSLTLMLDIPISVGAYMLSGSLVVVLSGVEFAAACSASRVLSLRMLVGPVNSLLISNLFIPLKKDRYAVIVTFVAALTDIMLNLILIPYIYHTGAAISTIAAEVIIFIIGIILSRNLVSFADSFKKIWQYIAAAIPIVPVCHCLSSVGLNNVLYILASAAISAVIYFSVLLIFKNPVAAEGAEIFMKKILPKLKRSRKNENGRNT